MLLDGGLSDCGVSGRRMKKKKGIKSPRHDKV